MLSSSSPWSYDLKTDGHDADDATPFGRHRDHDDDWLHRAAPITDRTAPPRDILREMLHGLQTEPAMPAAVATPVSATPERHVMERLWGSAAATPAGAASSAGGEFNSRSSCGLFPQLQTPTFAVADARVGDHHLEATVPRDNHEYTSASTTSSTGRAGVVSGSPTRQKGFHTLLLSAVPNVELEAPQNPSTTTAGAVAADASASTTTFLSPIMRYVRERAAQEGSGLSGGPCDTPKKSAFSASLEASPGLSSTRDSVGAGLFDSPPRHFHPTQHQSQQQQQYHAHPSRQLHFHAYDDGYGVAPQQQQQQQQHNHVESYSWDDGFCAQQQNNSHHHHHRQHQQHVRPSTTSFDEHTWGFNNSPFDPTLHHLHTQPLLHLRTPCDGPASQVPVYVGRRTPVSTVRVGTPTPVVAMPLGPLGPSSSSSAPPTPSMSLTLSSAAATPTAALVLDSYSQRRVPIYSHQQRGHDTATPPPSGCAFSTPLASPGAGRDAWEQAFPELPSAAQLPAQLSQLAVISSPASLPPPPPRPDGYVVLEFKQGRRQSFRWYKQRDDDVMPVPGEYVVVEVDPQRGAASAEKTSAPGGCAPPGAAALDAGICRLAALALPSRVDPIPKGVNAPVGTVVRVATDADCERIDEALPAKEEEAMQLARQLVHFLHLPFVVVDVECRFDLACVRVFYSLDAGKSSSVAPNTPRFQLELSHRLKAKVLVEHVRSTK